MASESFTARREGLCALEDKLAVICRRLAADTAPAVAPAAASPAALHPTVAAAVRAAQAAPSAAEVRAARAAPSTAEAGDEEWSVASWLGARAAAPVARALLRPLGSDPSSHAALAYARAIGSDRAAIRSVLDETLLDELADAVAAAASTLSGETSAAELSSKFAADTFTLSYSSLSAFFSGLEGRVGPPSPSLRPAMEREHCGSADSTTEFLTPNYGVSTTSEVEWWYVTEPERGLAALGRDEWPAEQHSIRDERRRRGDASAAPLAAFLPKLRAVNARLAKMGEPEMRLEELIGGRMYTGPCFQKYNTVLRGIGDDALPMMRERFQELTKGNSYCTTLHVINSCVIKGSKLSKAGRVYRGFGGGVLPGEFWQPNEFGVRGGVEASFR